MTEKLSACYRNTSFSCAEWVCGRQFSMAGKLSRWSQSTQLFHCSGHRKFVAMIRCSGNDWEAVWWSQKYHLSIPCVEWVCGREFSMGGKLSRWTQWTLCFTAVGTGHRNFVAMVSCSGNDWKAAWGSQRYHLSMCGRGLWSVEKFSIDEMDENVTTCAVFHQI